MFLSLDAIDSVVPLLLGHCQQLIPARRIVAGEVPLSHLPTLCHSLYSKHERLAPIDTIHRVNKSHQATLTVVLGERYFPEEIGLHHRQRDDPGELDACLFIMVASLVDGAQGLERILEQFGSKAGWIGKIDGKGVGVLWACQCGIGEKVRRTI